MAVRRQPTERPMRWVNSFVTVFSEPIALLRQFVVAKETVAARDCHRPNHPISDAQLFPRQVEQLPLNLVDNADRFVAEDARCWAGSSTGKCMEIAAADGTERNANECLTRGQSRTREALEPEWLAWLIEYRCADHVFAWLWLQIRMSLRRME
jgi:hypothetical protein